MKPYHAKSTNALMRQLTWVRVPMHAHHSQVHGLGEKDVHLHADNGGSQNKNITVGYLLWCVLTGLHNITLSLTLGACARVTVVVLCVCVCVSVTELADTYLVYTLKVRCH